MKRLVLALALSLLATMGFAQQAFPPESDGGGGGGATYDGGSVTNPFLAPDGTAALPGFAFTSDPTTGAFLGLSESFVSDPALKFSFETKPVLDIFEASGTEIFFEFQNPNYTATRMMRLRGDADLTRLTLWAPEETGSTVEYVLQNAVSTYLHGPSTNGTAPVHELRADDGTVPTLRMGEQTIYLDLKPTVNMASSKTITFPDATGTVALAGTKVSQALDLVTSEVSSGAGAATDLLFAPSNSTRYRMDGTFLVYSDTASYGLAFIVTWPTSDALAGQCTFRGPTDVNSHVWQIIGTGSTGSALKASWPSTPSVTDVPTFLIYMDCVFSTTTNTSGNFSLNFAGENVAGSYTLFAGSYFEWSVF